MDVILFGHERGDARARAAVCRRGWADRIAPVKNDDGCLGADDAESDHDRGEPENAAGCRHCRPRVLPPVDDGDRVAAALRAARSAGAGGVARDERGQGRGDREDRFFSTVFLGSGLLFLALLFIAAAVAGALIITHAGQAEPSTRSATFTLARAVTYTVLNVYAVKLAGVFMITTSTIAICSTCFR